MALGLRNQGFLLDDVVDQLLDVGATSDTSLLLGQVEQIYGLSLGLSVVAHILQNNSRWVVSEEELLELHRGSAN